MKLPMLFSPIRLGGVEIPNRCVMAPMGIGVASPDETWPLKEIRYLEERAAGGIGLIITPFTRVHGTLASVPMIGMYNDGFIASHRALVSRIHGKGAKIFLQLGLTGGKLGREAPSAIYSPNYAEKPRELTAGEIERLTEAFVEAAGRGVEAGYDGVEIHGGHTYFIGAMMSPATNLRSDAYGGSFEKRMKFPTDVILGILKEHPGLPVGFKFSAHEEIPGGVDLTLGKRIARHIASLGVAYLHVTSTASTIEASGIYPSVPPLYVPRNTLLPLAEEVKRECPGSVVIAAGSITVPEEAEELIVGGKCDMVALGRTMMADAHWPRKAREGKLPLPCIRCNVCYHQLWLEEPVACAVNPYLLREAEQELPRPARKKRVMVVGAGPAGIRCALTAARRGHEVTLYEKKTRIGGMVFPGSRPECKRDLRRLLEWFDAELASSRVALRLGVEAAPETVEAEKPDALVIAVGAAQKTLGVPGSELPMVVHAAELLEDAHRFRGGRAVVVGGGDVGCETACFLADSGWQVTIVEILPALMEKNRNTNVKIQMLRLIAEKGISVMTSTVVNEVNDDGIDVTLPNGKRWGVAADLVAAAMGYEEHEAYVHLDSMSIASKKPLTAALSMQAEEVHLIGDCRRPGSIREAVDSGERTGRWL